MKTDQQISWLPQPADLNYPAALSYLSLIYEETLAKKFVSALENTTIVNFKAKDIFRASCLSLLGISNYYVKKDKAKIREGIQLSPILLVRDSANGKVIIADGYHRLCAVYYFDEDALIPCKIV